MDQIMMWAIKWKGRNEWVSVIVALFLIVLNHVHKLYPKYSSDVFQNDDEEPKLNMTVETLLALRPQLLLSN